VVDFINILLAAFTSAYPKRAKRTAGLTLFFALLRYVRIKVASKMLVKSAPARDEGDGAKVAVVQIQNIFTY